jgi:hypothetical protein
MGTMWLLFKKNNCNLIFWANAPELFGGVFFWRGSCSPPANQVSAWHRSKTNLYLAKSGAITVFQVLNHMTSAYVYSTHNRAFIVWDRYHAKCTAAQSAVFRDQSTILLPIPRQRFCLSRAWMKGVGKWRREQWIHHPRFFDLLRSEWRDGGPSFLSGWRG